MAGYERQTEPWAAGPGAGERDAVFDALSHAYRRFLLEYLAESDGTATVTELAAALAAAQGRAGDAEPVGIDTIESALYHVHLPKLTEADLVRFDADGNLVHPTDRTQAVQPVFDAIEDL